MDKETLLASRLHQHKIDLSIGTIVVRPLSRSETLDLQSVDDQRDMETRMLSLAMVDPSITETDARTWADMSPPGEIEHVTEVIADISGLEGSSGKAAFQGDSE